MFKVEPYEIVIPEKIKHPHKMYSVKPVESDVTAGPPGPLTCGPLSTNEIVAGGLPTSTAPASANGPLSVKKVTFCHNISTFKPMTPTKAIDEKVTQVDGIVTTSGFPGEGGGGLENDTGIKKKSSFRKATRNFFIKYFSFLNLARRKKDKNKNKTDTSGADDQGDLKEKSIVVQSPPEKQAKKEEKKIESLEIHPQIQIEQEELKELEEYQLTIISKLAALKDNKTHLNEKAPTRNVSGVDATDPGETFPLDNIDVVTRNSSGVDATPGETPPLDYIDVVVNADPRRPPYSLLLFRKILKDYYVGGVRIKTHVHSSCTTPIPAYLNVFNIDENETLDGKEALTIRLIWKDTADLQTELIVKPIHQIPIAGEGNLARYFSRILPMTFPLNSYDPSYDTLDWPLLCKVDKILEDSRESDVNFEGIEKHLEATDGPFLLGQIMSIADYVFFSSAANALIFDYERIAEFPLTQQWLENCQIYGQFKLFNISI